MPPFAELADDDRQWFQNHPDRRHRARHATTTERLAFGADADLVMLIRHLGRGVLVHQPVEFSRQLPSDEHAIADLFDRAGARPEPVPVLTVSAPEALEPAA